MSGEDGVRVDFLYKLVGGPLDGTNVAFEPGRAPDVLTHRPRVYFEDGRQLPSQQVVSRHVYRLVGDPGGKAAYVYDNDTW